MSITLPPLPRSGPLGLIQYAGTDMQEYAAAVSAAKDARIKLLEGALRKAIVQNEHDMLMTGEELRAARAALGDKT